MGQKSSVYPAKQTNISQRRIQPDRWSPFVDGVGEDV